MPRAKKDSSHYRQAVEKLRGKHADKIEEIFLTMYNIVQDGKAENRDKVNAGKVAVSLLGVPRTAVERPPVLRPEQTKNDREHKPSSDEMKLINERLNA